MHPRLGDIGDRRQNAHLVVDLEAGRHIELTVSVDVAAIAEEAQRILHPPATIVVTGMEREAAIVVIAGEIVRILRNTGERQRGMTLVEHHLIRPDVRVIDLETQMAERAGQERSEEHTSELQSLMRISYAVFCLKKNK